MASNSIDMIIRCITYTKKDGFCYWSPKGTGLNPVESTATNNRTISLLYLYLITWLQQGWWQSIATCCLQNNSTYYTNHTGGNSPKSTRNSYLLTHHTAGDYPLPGALSTADLWVDWLFLFIFWTTLNQPDVE